MAIRGSMFCKWHQPDYVRARDRGPRIRNHGAGPGPGAQGQQDLGSAGTTGGNTGLPRNVVTGYVSPARQTLLQIARDTKASATARTSAARALAELDGYLGKHQQAPDRTADSLLSSLSRADLVRELARLRARSSASDST
jgi:hypothetical protein